MQRDLADLIELVDLRARSRGSAAILGGAPSLVSDLRSVPNDAVLFGVNQHALLLPLDYIVFCDPEVATILGDHPAKRITHHRALAEIWSGIAPDFGYSGACATWCAEYMGFEPIILCGMDNYSGSRRYWHSPPGQVERPHADPLACWIRDKRFLQRPDSVKVVSGPLVEVFGVYENRNAAVEVGRGRRRQRRDDGSRQGVRRQQ